MRKAPQSQKKAQNQPPFFRRPTLASLHRRSTQNDVEMQMQDRDRELETQRLRLVRAMFGWDQARETRLNAYFSFLDDQINASGRKQLAPLLALAGFSVQASLEDSLHVIADVATIVKEDNNSSRSVHSILQALLKQYGTTESSLEGSNRNSCWQAILVILCWLTALVKPDATSREETFKLLEYQAVLAAKRPFTRLLRSVGHILPESSDLEKNSPRPSGEHSSQIYVSSLNCWSLHTFGKVQLQWTDSLSAHLYFHQSSRTLYLFRFPSLCAVNLETEKATPLFKSLLLSYYSDTKTNEPLLDRYLQEVLLSYRVLFGQSRRSRKLFLNREKCLAATTSVPHVLDPLLNTLCGQGNAKSIRSLSSSLWPDTCQNSKGELLEQDVYDAALDFRLLGDRLLVLQAFNTRQRPSRIRDLWRDRRDPLQWYTFWLVLIIGGFSLLLSIAQCGLSAAQLYSQINSSQ